MQLNITQAHRGSHLKVSIALAGGPGAGKTHQGLLLAEQLADGGKILVIDTEAGTGSAEFYSRDPQTPPDGNLVAFHHAAWEGDFSPIKLTQAIKNYQKEYAVIMIDGLTPFWSREGGILEMVGDRGLSGWRRATPIQNKMTDAIVQAECHIVCTIRSKEAASFGTNEGGKVEIETSSKMGQRKDIAYEFTIIGEVDRDTHEMEITKAKGLSELEGKVVSSLEGVVGLGQYIVKWLKAGESTSQPAGEGGTAAEVVSGDAPLTKEQQEEIKGIFRGIQDSTKQREALNTFGDSWGALKEISQKDFSLVLTEVKQLASLASAPSEEDEAQELLQQLTS